MVEQIAISNLIVPATSSQYLGSILANDDAVQLQTTSWQSGGMILTVLQVMANIFSIEDAQVSLIAQGGFLDFAATGSVTYVNNAGVSVTQVVTPDPSIPGQNPLGTPGWLDTLADSVYNCQRVGATGAANTLALVNTTANTFNYTPGTYHVANPSTGASYSNTQTLAVAAAVPIGGTITGATNAMPIVITTSSAHGLTTGTIVYVGGVLGNTIANNFWVVTTTGTNTFSLLGSSGSGSYSGGGVVYTTQQPTFVADVAGPGGSSGSRQINQTVTANSGVFVSNILPFVGLPWEGNVALAARCRARLQSLSPNGPSGAYQYFALSAGQLLAAQTPSVTLSNAITKALVQQSNATGVVTVYVASNSGAVPGIVNLAITGATNATPIVIATTSAHGLSTLNTVTVTGVQGNTNANGTWGITVIDTSHFSLNGSIGNATYTGPSGSVDGGDLGEVDTIIQKYAVPDSVTATTASAITFDVAIVATLTVSSAYVSTYLTNAQTALALYFSAIPIGGGATGSIQYNDIIGVLYAAGIINGQASVVQSISSLTINGVSGNIAFTGPTYVAVLLPAPSLTVTGV